LRQCYLRFLFVTNNEEKCKEKTGKVKKFKHYINKFKKYMTFILVYLTVAGAYTFTAFIIEESQQQVIWGTWPAQDAKNWELVLEGCDLLESLNTTMWWINWTIGYIQPLALVSYHSYWRSTSYYMKSLKAKVFAKSPESFDGRYVEFSFTPKKVTREKEKVILANRRIRVIMDKDPGTKKIKVSGIVRVEDNKVYIDMEEKK